MDDKERKELAELLAKIHAQMGRLREAIGSIDGAARNPKLSAALKEFDANVPQGARIVRPKRH